MSTQPNLTNPFELARRTLIAALSRMSVPRAIGSFASPADFEAVNDCIRRVYDLADSFLGDVGFQVSDNSPIKLDMTLFDHPGRDAIEGNATYEVERAIEALIEAHREVA